MPQQIILRRGLATAWTAANPVLLPGEPGVESDTGKIKIGNTAGDAWNDLPYVNQDIPPIPVNLADLADVSSTVPSTGQVLKWNGSTWAPAADNTGGGGGGSTTLDGLDDVVIAPTVANGDVLKYDGTDWVNATNNLDGLSDVSIGGGVTTGQVLRWNGTSWANATPASVVTYNVSTDTDASGARIVLNGSDTTTDFIRFSQGADMTVTRISDNTITFTATNSKYVPSVTLSPTNDVRITSAEFVGGTATGIQQHISITGQNQVTVNRTSSSSLSIDAKNTVYSLDTSTQTGGVRASFNGTPEATGLVGTVDTASNILTLTSGSTKGLRAGLTLTKTAGDGVLAAATTIASVDSLTQLTLSALPTTSGSVTFTATSIMTLNFFAPVDSGLTITQPSEGVVQFDNINGKVTSGTVGRLAIYSDGVNLTTVGASNDGLTWDQATRYLVVTSGRLALRQTDLQMVHNSYGTGARSDGLQYAQYYGTTTESRAWNIIRARGTSTAPATVITGDELFELRAYGQYGSGTNDLAVAANMRFIAKTISPGFVGSDILFSTGNGISSAAPRLIIREAGHVEINKITAIGSGGNGDLELEGIGTGTVRLPAGTTVGGVGIGTLTFAGTTANATTRAALSPTSGQVWIQQDNLHGYLWNGTSWIDLDVIQGPPGTAGTNGTNGTSATVAVGTVTTGAAGSSAIITNSGTSLAAVLDFTIPKGDQGDPGSAATVSVGTVTTGAPGSSASVTNGGTSSAAVLNFTIPRGDVGAGVATGGAAGQVLAKIDTTNYNTEWVTLSTVATSGEYADLANTPVIPDSILDLGITDGAAGTVLTTDGAGNFTFQAAAGGGGDVSFTATAISVNDAPSPINGQAGACSVARFDGTTGNLIQSSLVTITDNGMILAPSVGSCIPFAWGSSSNFPDATTYRGALAHSNAAGTMHYSNGTSWIQLAKSTDIPSVPVNLADLSDVSATAPSTGQVLKWSGTEWAPAADSTGSGSNSFSTIAVSGQNSVVADSTTDTLTLVAGTGISITTNDSTDTITITATGGGGGGSSLQTRTTVSGSTGSLADAGTGPINITGFKGYMLMKVETSAAAWVRIYTSEAARLADASRLEGTDPSPGAGVIAEVITTGAQTVMISPGAYGFNDEVTPTTNIPVRVTNKSGSTATITVTLTVLQLEA